MKRFIKNIKIGLSNEALTFVNKNSSVIKTNVYDRTGSIKSIKLLRFELNDGSIALETLQMTLENEKGQILYFTQLETLDGNFKWTAKQMLSKVEYSNK